MLFVKSFSPFAVLSCETCRRLTLNLVIFASDSLLVEAYFFHFSLFICFISACWDTLLVLGRVVLLLRPISVCFVCCSTRFEEVGLSGGNSMWQLGRGGRAFDQCLAGRPAVVCACVLP